MQGTFLAIAVGDVTKGELVKRMKRLGQILEEHPHSRIDEAGGPRREQVGCH